LDSELIEPAPRALLRFAPLVAVVFLGMFTVGMPLPVLPAQVHNVLGYGTVMVGWVIGCQSFATLATRRLAGGICDARGPKPAVLLGLPCAAAAGVLYLISTVMPGPGLSLAVLVAGRLVLGFAESLFLTGAMTWGIARVGPRHTGQVMAWQGIAMYAAFAAGGPLGLAVLAHAGFAAVAVTAIVVPLLGLLVAVAVPAVAPSGQLRSHSFISVLGLIWQPGAALAFGTVAVGAITGFVTLDFAHAGWSGAGYAFLCFGGGYIVVRLFLAHLPDRLGGRRVAAASLVIEAVGQIVLWAAPTEAMALAGALLTGIGFSLVFPAMGVEAMRRAPPASRGLAVGGYIAFFDIAVGVAGPLCGVVAAVCGYPAVFLAGGVASLAAIATVMAMPEPQ
jgi:MFS family permease